MQITPLNIEIRVPAFPKVEYSHGQELFYKFVSKITNKLVKTTLVHDCRPESGEMWNVM